LEFPTAQAITAIEHGIRVNDRLQLGGRGIREEVEQSVLKPLVRWTLDHPLPTHGVRMTWPSKPPYDVSITAIA
jgi:hypothetical protein